VLCDTESVSEVPDSKDVDEGSTVIVTVPVIIDFVVVEISVNVSKVVMGCVVVIVAWRVFVPVITETILVYRTILVSLEYERKLDLQLN
jgi:hypothetical protein